MLFKSVPSVISKYLKLNAFDILEYSSECSLYVLALSTLKLSNCSLVIVPFFKSLRCWLDNSLLSLDNWFLYSETWTANFSFSLTSFSLVYWLNACFKSSYSDWIKLFNFSLTFSFASTTLTSGCLAGCSLLIESATNGFDFL